MKRVAIVLCLLSMSSAAWAQLGMGTWVNRSSPSSAPRMMLVIEPAGPGVKLTYRMLGPNGAPAGPGAMTIVSGMDGKDAPMMVDGKDTGQTMAIRRVDATHTATVMKFQGKAVGTSKSELSADGKTLTVENDMSPSNPSAQKTIEYWDKR